MIIECPICEAKVNAKLIAEHVDPPSDEWEPYLVSLLECPSCKNTIVAGSDYEYCDGPKTAWSSPVRLWPSPPKYFNLSIPVLVRRSLLEARKCYNAKIYPACAVMCGKVIEAICLSCKTKNQTLHGGLKELRDRKIIDGRIYKWGEELRKERNIGAHVSAEETTKDNARDVLDFAIAICDYIFVLSEKYKNFIERKAKKSAKKKEKT